MIGSRFRNVLLVLGMAALLVAAAPVQAVAQDDGEAADEAQDEAREETAEEFEDVIVVTGSRTEGRSVVESMVPFDVLKTEDFTNQGATDVSELLRNVAPSYNVNTQPISDAATVVRPANLRNLAPDHTLVLVNGKRRHRAAVIYWLGNGVADGAQGPDISAIPAIALRQVEVLRDGASAQYGSDAIAGVMNFMLKDSSSGGSVEIRTGEYAEGDGAASSVAANFGLPMGENGFFNFSIEAGQSDPTDRSVQRNDAAALIAAGNTDVRNPAQIWGSPEVEDDIKVWANFGKVTGGGQQFYGHANYVSKTVTGGFFFRNPNTRGAVFSG
ncbi:MAG: TonB-dependent receptor plug domain-containing protein, partial [Acidobacteriota bacterium]|nr:TonB-dependent receptor plug domain-containing protein [Acidobacteriota bacterium]